MWITHVDNGKTDVFIHSYVNPSDAMLATHYLWELPTSRRSNVAAVSSVNRTR